MVQKNKIFYKKFKNMKIIGYSNNTITRKKSKMVQEIKNFTNFIFYVSIDK